MRLPIDTTTIKFAAAGAAEPVLDFATKSQKTDEHGVPLFQVPVFAAGGGIKDSITIKVAGDVKGLSEFTLLKISGLVGQTCDHPPAGRTPRIGGMNRTGFDGGRSQPVNATISANFSDGCIVDCLELDWRNVAEVAVQSLVVVPVHPSEGLQFEVVNGLPWPSSRPSREFGLVEGVDGFSEGVIERITNGSDGGASPDLVKSLAITNTRELRPGVLMQTQVVEPGAALPPCHFECVEHHLGAHVARDTPTNDVAAELISDETDVGDPLPGGKARQISDPELVRCARREVAFDEVG